MQNTDFPPLEPPPPPPPLQEHDRRRFWTGIAVGAGAMLVLVLILGSIGWAERDKISGLFASPTPEGIPYTNSSIGISLQYPVGWDVYQESTDRVIFTLSQAGLTADSSTAGGYIEIQRLALSDLTFQSEVDLTKPENILNAIISEGVGSGVMTLEAVRTYNQGQFPAAVTTLAVDTGSDFKAVTHVAIILLKQDVVVFLGLIPQEDWTQYHPIFDKVLNSLTIKN